MQCVLVVAIHIFQLIKRESTTTVCLCFRAYSAFLIELAERVPDLVRHCLSLLMVHLDGESYPLRKCVLSIFCEIILKTLMPAPAPEQPDASQPGMAGGETGMRQQSIAVNTATTGDEDLVKETRDQLLDCLEDHVHDAHAFVRSSVLQAWGRLCMAKAIPLSRQERLLRLVIGRLQDKSSNVRKQSVQLLTALLQCNPYTATMPVEEFKEQLKEAEVKLAEMTGRVRGKEEKREAEWELFRNGELTKALDAWNANMDEEDTVTHDAGANTRRTGDRKANRSPKSLGQSEAELEPVWDNATRDEVYSRLQHLMQKNQAKRALSLLKNAQDMFPEDEIFNAMAIVSATANVEGVNIPNEKEKFEVILQTIFLTDLHFNRLDQDTMEEDIRKQETIVNYFRDCVAFGVELNKALPTVCLLLGSKQVSDVLEAINFFVSAFEFGVLNAMMGVRKMLTLIFSREQDIKKAVVGAYKRLYIDQTSPKQIVKNLIALIEGASVGEIASLEELVLMLVESKDIGKECFQLLWQYFTMAGASTTEEEARAAVVMLGMVANTQPTIITSNLCLLVNKGLQQAATKKSAAESEKGGQTTNFRLVHDTCVALSKVANIKHAKEKDQQPLKFEAGHDIFLSLEAILIEGIWNFRDPFFIPMSQKALMVVYLLSEQPDMLAGRVIKSICSDLNKKELWPEVDRRVIQRLISIIGHVSLCQLNHLDVSVLSEMKRRKTIRETKAEEKLKSTKKSIGSNKRRQSKTASAPVDDGDDDLEVVGAEADDTEFEFIRNVCESEVVTSPDTLIPVFLPLVQDICANPAKYPEPNLRSAASLTLAKIMLVSSVCCEKYLQLLFTVMEKSPEPVIRANLVVATGDLSFRFPNTMEPWTPHMYKMLRDTSSHVRSNTLAVLTHLILNDMIKVKGQISDIAFCIADATDRIAGLAKHFFSELSRKGNALYNVMPDIISRLSTSSSSSSSLEVTSDSVPVPEDTFRAIMCYIVGLIEKDKHLESLVEKLCQRFRVTNCERQWRDLAFCLSLFKYNDRAVKKLAENFLCFSDKLHEEEVNNAFLGILVHSRKQVKQDTKLAIDELEEKMAKARDKCLEDNSTSKRALAAKISKKGPPSVMKARKRKKAFNDNAEDDPDFE